MDMMKEMKIGVDLVQAGAVIGDRCGTKCVTGICDEVKLILGLVSAIRRTWRAKRSRDRKYPVASMPLQTEDLYHNTH